jgi:hypothetical protein
VHGCQITVSEPLGVAGVLCDALAVVLVGALGAGPLAESEVDGLVEGGVAVGVGVPGSDGVGVGEVGVDGFVGGLVEDEGGFGELGFGEDGGFEDVGGFDGDAESLGSREPLGESVGVGSSDVPIVPSGPGSVGRAAASPVPPPPSFDGRSAPRLPSLMPWLADGLTPTWSDGGF